MNKNLGPQIVELRQEGKSYNEIAKILSCSKGTVAYHLGDSQKVKTLARQTKNRADGVDSKVNSFREAVPSPTARHAIAKRASEFSRRKLKLDDVKQRVLDTKDCYLCGLPIDYDNFRSYHFDHILPVCLGGDNTIENLGIVHSHCNFAKRGMRLEDFLALCKQVVTHHNL